MNPPVFRPTPDELTQEKSTVGHKLGRDLSGWLAKKLGINLLSQHDTVPQLTAKEQVLNNLSSVVPCQAHQDPRPDQAHSGECSWCHQVHTLQRSPAAVSAVTALHADLIAENQKAVPPRDAANAKGKMIGVLICKDENGVTQELKAFSGPPSSIVNVKKDWCRIATAPSVENFIDDPSQPATRTSRAFVPADQIDNPTGNCAAQKLLYHVADYNKNEAGRRIAPLTQRIQNIEQERSDLFQDVRDANSKTLRTWLEGLTSEEMEKLELTPERRRHLLDDPSDRATGNVRTLRFSALNKMDPDLRRLDREKADLERQIEAIRANPPKLIPVGLAEAWMGAELGGFPPKKNGEIIDSCYTCHNTLGDVLCGLEELQKRFGI